MALAISALAPKSEGSQLKVDGLMTFSSTYATGGEAVTAAQLGLSMIQDMNIEDSGGYLYDCIIAADKLSAKIKVYTTGAAGTSGATSGGTPAQSAGVSLASTSGGTPAGSITGRLDLAVPAFSGTGHSTAGQVVTTDQNQTMTLNQCAGMWLVDTSSVTSAPVLILSNTAVAGAPAVLTVQGVPTATNNASTWQIVTLGAATFVGSALAAHTHVVTQATYSALATHTHTTGAAAGTEFSGTLSVAVNFQASGV